ncbi:MAG TPA: hypothetical protein VFG30_13520 [Polyangiales bacterium]|nr:hypothetical protein [Polyangiales bacterium]
MASSTFSVNTGSSTSADPSGTYGPAWGLAAARLPRVAARRMRGCTRPGRLARLDRILQLREAELIGRIDGEFRDAPLVDVGVGEWPWTTIETAHSLRAFAPSLRVIGVELDPDRLRHARRFEEPGLEFRRGGFELPLGAAERPRVVRALNLLRGYSETEARAAHAMLSAALLPGGLLIEGTSSPSGGVLCVHLLRKRGARLAREGLLFSTDFSQGYAPVLFRDRLPRDLRRRSEPGSAMHGFFEAWTQAFAAARSTGLCENAALFALSAQLLASRVPGIVGDAALHATGALLWQPPGGVPSPGDLGP